MSGPKINKETIIHKEPLSILALGKRAGLDGFMLALVGMIILAWLWPQVGKKESPFALTEIAGYGISFIFFFYGLRLSMQKLKAGLSKWRLHLVIHITTFIVFPLLVLTAKFLFENDSNQLLWLGIFFLASLPSTVSSSVVMVSIAGGNMPAAIFNASISSLMGVFITPLWMGMLLKSDTESFDLGDIFGKLVLQVLVPVALGILLHSRWGNFAENYRKQLRYFDQTIILLIVYTSFCESFAKHLFRGINMIDLLVLVGGMIGLFLIVYMLVNAVSSALAFSREDRITAIFCGSKKSLVHGTLMSKVLFAGSDIVGIVILPIMLYHTLQLIAASIMAHSMARKPGAQSLKP